MKHPLRKILTPIRELQSIRGIQLPVGLEFRQLIVTGPPGAGKTYYINQIRGWPNEGYLDLSSKGWWRDRSLVYRPREVHLGLPYRGYREALAVFDQQWVEADPNSLEIDYARIKLPPERASLLGTNWRDKYIFEFILPDPEEIYQRRLNRQDQGYFPADANLSLELVRRQFDAYCSIALYLHRAGLNVYVRRNLEEAPLLISEKGAVALPPWAVSPQLTDRPHSLLGTVTTIFRHREHFRWFQPTNRLQSIDQPVRISHDGKDLDLVLGRQHLRLTPELPLGASKRYLRLHKNWLIKEPRSCFVKDIHGFARIKPGETVMLGTSNREYRKLFAFKSGVAKRHLTITNSSGDLLLRPLEPEQPVKVVRLDEHDYRENLTSHRISAMLELRKLFGGRIAKRAPAEALDLILAVNDLMAAEPCRPRDHAGLPGGLVELPDRPTPVVVGDLHAQVNNLLKILTENCLLEALAADRAVLCLLGDAVHSEVSGKMRDMEDSILIMELIFLLKRAYPANVFYIRGNHDDFGPELSKNTVPQGLLMKQALLESRGPAYVEAMSTFYDRLPHLIVSDSMILCHAGPPRAGTTRQQLIDLRSQPNLAKELTHSRPKRAHYLSGYTKGDVKALRRTLEKPKSVPVIVGHTPLDPFGSIWQNAAGIKNHHIVYSSHQEGPAFFARIRGTMMPLSYPMEPLVRLINRLREE